MAQGFKSFPLYFTEFHCYTKETGQNKSVLINCLIKSLNPKLKASFVGVKLLNTITACANSINGLYNNILRLALKYIF